MDIPDKVLVLVGAITAALIAGIVSLVNMMIAKDQKITEFRQAWIDSLREEVARMVAHATMLPFAGRLIEYADSKSKAGPEAVAAQVDRMLNLAKEKKELMDAYNKILLFLNPNENKALVAKLAALAAVGAIASDTGQSKIEGMAVDALAETQRTLKKEWERVKKGEWVYRLTKYGIVILVPVLLAASLYFFESFVQLHLTGEAAKAADPNQGIRLQVGGPPPSVEQH